MISTMHNPPIFQRRPSHHCKAIYDNYILLSSLICFFCDNDKFGKLLKKDSRRALRKRHFLSISSSTQGIGRVTTGQDLCFVSKWKRASESDPGRILATSISNSFFTLKKYFRFVLLDPTTPTMSSIQTFYWLTSDAITRQRCPFNLVSQVIVSPEQKRIKFSDFYDFIVHVTTFLGSL